MQRRNTKQKKIVYETLELLGHSTIDFLIEYIQMHYASISLATIYRNIQALQDEGKIKMVKLQDKNVLETVKEEHCHFVCESCGNIMDLNVMTDEIVESAKGLYPHQFKNCDIAFYGVCQKCKEKEKRNEVRL